MRARAVSSGAGAIWATLYFASEPTLPRFPFPADFLLRWLIPLLVSGAWPFAAQAVDVNLANASQLESVRGIGPKTAATIVRERQQHGPFSSYGNLADRVGGIGAKRLERLKQSGLTVGPSGVAQAASARSANVIVNTPNPGKGKGN